VTSWHAPGAPGAGTGPAWEGRRGLHCIHRGLRWQATASAAGAAARCPPLGTGAASGQRGCDLRADLVLLELEAQVKEPPGAPPRSASAPTKLGHHTHTGKHIQQPCNASLHLAHSSSPAERADGDSCAQQPPAQLPAHLFSAQNNVHLTL